MVACRACILGPLMNLLPRRRVTFNDPKDKKDPAREEAGCLTEPSVGNLETWLEFQVGQLGTPSMVGRTGGHTRHSRLV